MPSQLHDVIVELFRNRPELAPELLQQALGVELPRYTEVRIESADFTDVQPPEYRADLIVVLYKGEPVYGVVVEVQLAPDAQKRLAWPVYAAVFRSKIKTPTCVLVITPTEAVARWAARPIDLGGGNTFMPMVIGPSGVPVVTDVEVARQDPELAVLSAMAHGKGSDLGLSLKVAVAALTASVGLDEDRSLLYYDLVRASLSEAVKKELQAMDPATYEYQSDFAKHYVAKGIEQGLEQGEAKGREEGVAEGIVRGETRLLLKMLTRRFGPLPEEAVARIESSDAATIEALADRFVNAESLSELFE